MVNKFTLYIFAYTIACFKGLFHYPPSLSSKQIRCECTHCICGNSSHSSHICKNTEQQCPQFGFLCLFLGLFCLCPLLCAVDLNGTRGVLDQRENP